MLTDSNLLSDLKRYAISAAGQPLCIYGDAAYPLRVNLQGLFRNEQKKHKKLQALERANGQIKSTGTW